MSDQQNWFDLQDSFLSEEAKTISSKEDISDEEYEILYQEKRLAEKKAKQELVRRLKQFIVLIESPGYPDVFGCQLPRQDPPCSNGEIVDHISVTLSHVWPG